MEQKNQKLKRKSKISRLILIGFSLILLGIAIVTTSYGYKVEEERKEQKSLEYFYEEQIDNNIQMNEETNEVIKDNGTDKKIPSNIEEYTAVIKIPSIGLEKGLFHKNNYLNNVDKNIEILAESDMPDVENGNVILASHNGNSNVSYFKDINKLNINDKITIYYNQNIYEYKVMNMYEIEKNGTANIVRNNYKDTLTLITCVTNEEKQLVVISEKVEVDNGI